jgi:hypothetical protein
MFFSFFLQCTIHHENPRVCPRALHIAKLTTSLIFVGRHLVCELHTVHEAAPHRGYCAFALQARLVTVMMKTREYAESAPHRQVDHFSHLRAATSRVRTPSSA